MSSVRFYTLNDRTNDLFSLQVIVAMCDDEFCIISMKNKKPKSSIFKKKGVYYIFPTPTKNKKNGNMLDNNIFHFMNTWIKTYINT